MSENVFEPESETQNKKFEALGRFAGGIAHDFNNILSVIEASAAQAVKELAAGNLNPYRLEKIRAATKRGAGITRQLLSFSRQKINLGDTVNLTATIRQMKDLLQEAAGPDVALVFDLPENDIWCEIDADEIFQVMMNLVTNARDAQAGQAATVGISCRIEQNNIELVVKDNGPGIPDHILPYIFDPFFTTKKQGQGIGLGLSVVHGIVYERGGKIAVNSLSGQGASFHVFLPIAAPNEEREDSIINNKPYEFNNSLEGKTVLLAEDDGDLREVLAVMLGDMKMKVMTATNGNEAYRIQQEYEGDIDFLLSDIIMPEMDGVDLAKAFQHDRPKSNIVLMSGYPFAREREGKNIPDKMPMLSKPFDSDHVRRVLERALEVRDQERPE
jgi:two-component system cell cycle sensor histidine kinase/response regulator CckA